MVLTSTGTGSILVSDTRISAEQFAELTRSPRFERLPQLTELNWALLACTPPRASLSAAREFGMSAIKSLAVASEHIRYLQGMLKTSNATLVIQNLAMRKAARALRKKEGGKIKSRSFFPQGLGRILTTPDFETILLDNETERTTKANEKAAKKAARAASKQQNVDLARQWEEIKAAHNTAIAVWEETCSKLKQQGVRAKDLPRKPKRAPKPKKQSAPVAESEDSSSSGDDSSSDSD